MGSRITLNVSGLNTPAETQIVHTDQQQYIIHCLQDVKIKCEEKVCKHITKEIWGGNN